VVFHERDVLVGRRVEDGVRAEGDEVAERGVVVDHVVEECLAGDVGESAGDLAVDLEVAAMRQSSPPMLPPAPVISTRLPSRMRATARRSTPKGVRPMSSTRSIEAGAVGVAGAAVPRARVSARGGTTRSGIESWRRRARRRSVSAGIPPGRLTTAAVKARRSWRADRSARAPRTSSPARREGRGPSVPTSRHPMGDGEPGEAARAAARATTVSGVPMRMGRAQREESRAGPGRDDGEGSAVTRGISAEGRAGVEASASRNECRAAIR
jgi:hypothetical protein